MSTSPEQIVADSPVKYGCDCIEKANRPDGMVAQKNTQLDVNWQINRETGAVLETVAISTSVLVKKRGARPIRIIPNYCPMCGTRYVPPATPEAAQPPTDGAS